MSDRALELDKPLPRKALSLTLLVALLLGLGLRVLFLYQTDFVIDSDEAIVGLMAKHIIDGREWPIFYYGQDYMGSLEAILTSLSFVVFGMSSAALKVVPLLFSILQITLVYQLAKRFVDSFSAILAALLCACGPITLILWSTKARGGFIEVVALGTIALVVSCDILKDKKLSYKNLKFKMMALGLSLGLGWWVNNQISYYMLPIGLIVGASLFARQGIVKGFKLGIICLCSFIVGGAPFWYANIWGQKKWATFEVLFGGSGEVDVIEHFSGFFSGALPIIFGARRFWSQTDVFPYASSFFYAVYGLAFLAVVFKCVTQREDRASLGLLLGFICSVAVIFSTSRFGWLYSAPRYILPLYSVVFVVLAIGFNVLRNSNSKILRVSVLPAFVLILLAQLSPLVLGPGITIGQPFVAHGDRVSKDHSELYSWLDAQQYTHIHTNYWIGYRTAFETSERILFTRYSEPFTLRIPEYEKNTDNFPLVYVLVPKQAQEFTSRLDLFHISYRVSSVGEYLVVDQIDSGWAMKKEISLHADMFHSPLNKHPFKNVLDSDLNSRWGSGQPQNPEMYIDIHFDEPTMVSGVKIEFGRFTHDAPQHLVLYGKRGKGEWVVLQDLGDHGGILGFAGYGDEIWKVGFRLAAVDKLRFAQEGSHSLFDWSIAELKVFGPK